MSFFFALFRSDFSVNAPEDVAGCASALAAAPFGHWQWGPLALGCLPGSPSFHSLSQCAITAVVRLDNRAELQSAVAHESCTDALLILLSYLKWGEGCVARLRGDFAFALWDGRRRHLFCARDHFGVKPFYYHHGGGRFACTGTLRGLLALPEVGRQLDEGEVADVLSRNFSSRTATVYRDIHRLPPAHWLRVEEGGLVVREYWRPDPGVRLSLADDRAYEEGFRHYLRQAVARRLPASGAVGLEMSGGIDSSALAAMAVPLLGEQGRELSTFTHVLSPRQRDVTWPYSDEWTFAQRLCDHLGIRQRNPVWLGRFPLLESMDHAAAVLGEPDRFRMAFVSRDLYQRAAEAGVGVLLSGFGGDEVATVPGEKVLRLELAAEGRWGDLWRESRGCAALHGCSPWRPFVGAILRRRFPALWRRIRGDQGGVPGVAQRLAACLVQDAHRDQVAARLQGNTAALVFPQSIVDDQIGRLLHGSFGPRLESCDQMACAHGLDCRYPFLDLDLVTFCLALPREQKARHGWSRHLARRALAPHFPDGFHWRPGKFGNSVPSLYGHFCDNLPSLLARAREMAQRPASVHWIDQGRLLARLNALAVAGGQVEFSVIAGMNGAFLLDSFFLHQQMTAAESYTMRDRSI